MTIPINPFGSSKSGVIHDPQHGTMFDDEKTKLTNRKQELEEKSHRKGLSSTERKELEAIKNRLSQLQLDDSKKSFKSQTMKDGLKNILSETGSVWNAKKQ